MLSPDLPENKNLINSVAVAFASIGDLLVWRYLAETNLQTKKPTCTERLLSLRSSACWHDERNQNESARRSTDPQKSDELQEIS